MVNHPAWQGADIGSGARGTDYRQELAMVEIQQTGKDKDSTQDIVRDKSIEITEFKSPLFD